MSDTACVSIMASGRFTTANVVYNQGRESSRARARQASIFWRCCGKTAPRGRSAPARPALHATRTTTMPSDASYGPHAAYPLTKRPSRARSGPMPAWAIWGAKSRPSAPSSARRPLLEVEPLWCRIRRGFGRSRLDRRLGFHGRYWLR